MSIDSGDYAAAVCELIEVVDIDSRFTPAKAKSQGYAPVEAYAEATGRLRDYASRALRYAHSEGKVERVKIGKGWWYRKARKK